MLSLGYMRVESGCNLFDFGSDYSDGNLICVGGSVT